MKKSNKLDSSTLVLAAAVMIGLVTTSPASDVTRSVVQYSIPQVTLVRDDGKSVWLPEELNDGRPVVMNFVFTTCTSICPLLSQTLARLQDELGAEQEQVHIVSISIDPEQDTPARLREYARRYHAGQEWQHYTGKMESIIETAKAFSVYRGDKMSHTPVTLVRPAPDKPWIRFDGFATPDELLREIPGTVAATR